MKILGVATSPRCSGVTQALLDDIVVSKDISDTIYQIGYKGKISNSEALLLAALWGAKQEGADVEIIYPNKSAYDVKYDGVILATPVYFGDRSSGLHDFIHHEADFSGKAVGIVSAGAKRNGGQETTNIYALYDCLSRGALITGNGPPTAQYGGTGWAGNKTAIVNDDFGIKTSYGTGRQVAKLARLATSEESNRKPNIVFLIVTKDKISHNFSKIFQNFNVSVVDITKLNIKRCVACPVCPNGDLSDSYTCIIRNDDMRKAQEVMKDADCIVFVSATDDLHFQVFIERTRFIRRNHFELSERVYSSMSFTNSITDILPLRVMTNMLRQNMFGIPFYKKFDMYYSNMQIESYVSMLEKYTRKSITARKISGVDYEYTAVGYEDAKRDEKAYRD
jgi:multimeric flavodoxin WrbA